MTSIDDNDDNAVGAGREMERRNKVWQKGGRQQGQGGRTCCGSVPDVSNRLVNKMSTFFRLYFFRVLEEDLLFLFSVVVVVIAVNLIESTLW